jgi:molybdopterin/thiamine biosynthesis adenylyltransferase
MLTVLVLMAALWGLGAWLGAPAGQRAGVVGLVWAGVVGLHLALPDGHPLRAATGGEARVWLALGAVAGLALAYRAGLALLRRRAAAPAAPAAPVTDALSVSERDRYARHIFLREIGGTGQRRLKAARVLVVGAGGLGAPAILYLGAAGVGTIGVIDDDTVEVTNLQRQIIHADARIGVPKVFSAAAAVAALNPHVTVRPYHRRLTAEIAADLFADYDLILDGSDSFDTREMVNATAVRGGKPLIAAAIAQWEGQISLYHPAAGTPCLACVFPKRPAPGLVPTCAEAGVAGPLPGVLGSLMALEAVKHLTAAGETLAGRMLLYDALGAETRVIALSRRADCPVCGAGAAHGWTPPGAAP